ncbi:COX15/CtaA family protein [Microbacterium luticocti]|uniref:COX15/CtaA family protein n=1 Tax=Microbacterium luticocti TaxID=451764 RepID=UPI00048E2DE4|nr:COX15/CtaA family protein [Microbacterium luticocti]
MSTDLSTADRTTVPGNRFWRWLPAQVDRRVIVAAWISFVTEVLIIGTGGAVRLTGSGLGCEWPLCAPDSLVPIAGMGLHSYIEFGNRLMTGVVGLAALAVLILTLRMRRERRELFVLAVVVVAGVLAQAVVGGITVLTGLNAWIVGFHFFATLVLVAASAAYLVRAYATPGPRTLAVPRWYAILAHVTSLFLVLTLAVGIVTTGSGPHSGDADVVRHGPSAEILAHVHSIPGYTLFGLVVVLVAAASVQRLQTLRWGVLLLVVLVVQIPVGIYQARTGLPALAVGVHMVLAGLAVAAMTALVLALKKPAD